MTKLQRRMRGRSTLLLAHTPVSVTRDVIAEAASVLFDMRERLLRAQARVGERGETPTEAQRRKLYHVSQAAQHVNVALYLANTGNWTMAKESLVSAVAQARLSHVLGATVAVREALQLARGLNV